MLPEVGSLRFQSLWLLKKALPSREEPDISLSILNSVNIIAPQDAHKWLQVAE